MRISAIGLVAVVLFAAACATETETVESVAPAEASLTSVETTTTGAAPGPIATTTTAPMVVSNTTTTDPITVVTVTTQPSREEKGGGNKVKPTAPAYRPGEDVSVAIADLSNRLGIDHSEITVVSVEEVTWPDGSIGCPQPGMAYSQALVNGRLLVLQANGITYEYHSASGGGFFYCATPTSPVPGEAGDV